MDSSLCSSSNLKPPSCDDSGFYGTYRRLFERLSQEEVKASPYPNDPPSSPLDVSDFPTFGYSYSIYSKKKGEEGSGEEIKDFYSFWLNFSTRKSFGWKDQYKINEAPDRRVRRLMEKENKTARENGRREYNDTVRTLVSFVRKRDPRFVKYQTDHAPGGEVYKAQIAARQKEINQKAKEREEAAKAYRESERKANGNGNAGWNAGFDDGLDSEFESEEEEDSHSDDDQDVEEDEDDQEDDEDGEEQEEGNGVDPNSMGAENASGGWDCVACDKIFQNEKTWLNHEKSKKHRQAVWRLKKEMRAEEKELQKLEKEETLDKKIEEEIEEKIEGDEVLSGNIEAMGLEDYGEEDEALDLEGLEVSAGFSIPSNEIDEMNEKNAKKQKKKNKKKRGGQNLALDEDGYFAERLESLKKGENEIKVEPDQEVEEDLNEKASQKMEKKKGNPKTKSEVVEDEKDLDSKTGIKNSNRDSQRETATSTPEPRRGNTGTTTPAVDQTAHLLPPLGERPEGSFDVFGYGSLIFKPPPHVIGRTPGFIKGFARRFAQSSIDHRGTPSRPGRVVTLVSSSDWHQFKEAEDVPEGDIVWGVSWTIDPKFAKEVRDYLDDREKNGYSPTYDNIYGIDSKTGQEVILIRDALIYVGLVGNPAFVGPSNLDSLAERIVSCKGPSGPNDEYVLNLAKAIRKLSPDTKDSHLFTLEEKVLALKERARKEEEKKEGWKTSTVKEDLDSTPPQGKKARRNKKEKEKEKETCNVCSTGFESRSKLFVHIKATGHALAPNQGRGGLDSDEEGTRSAGGRTGKKKGRK